MRHFTPIQRPEGEDPWERHGGLSRYERITIANIRLCRAYLAARDERLKDRLAEAGERTYAWLHDVTHEHSYEDCPSHGATEIAAALEQTLAAIGASDSTVPVLNLNEHLSGDETKSILDQIKDAVSGIGHGVGVLSGDPAQDLSDAFERMGIQPDEKLRVVMNTRTGEEIILRGDEEWEAFKAEHGADNIKGGADDTPLQNIVITDSGMFSDNPVMRDLMALHDSMMDANPVLKDLIDALDPKHMSFDEMGRAVDDALDAVASQGTWNVPGSNMKIRLLTPDEFDAIPDGTVLYNIYGVRMVKGTDSFNDQTRGGYLAFGPAIEEA